MIVDSPCVVLLFVDGCFLVSMDSSHKLSVQLTVYIIRLYSGCPGLEFLFAK